MYLCGFTRKLEKWFLFNLEHFLATAVLTWKVPDISIVLIRLLLIIFCCFDCACKNQTRFVIQSVFCRILLMWWLHLFGGARNSF